MSLSSRITLKPLPYDLNALEPFISERTLSIHYGKHHAGYVAKLNELLEGSSFKGHSLEEIILQTHNKEQFRPLFNNAGQIWNHTFYWESMVPNGGGAPKGKVLKLIEDSFGTYDQFKTQFKDTALAQFGSGWTWLVQSKKGLKIVKTSNAETPLTDSELTPLMTCDVWEHAYYLDYQNKRLDYVEVFLRHLVNWEFVTHNV